MFFNDLVDFAITNIDIEKERVMMKKAVFMVDLVGRDKEEEQFCEQKLW